MRAIHLCITFLAFPSVLTRCAHCSSCIMHHGLLPLVPANSLILLLLLLPFHLSSSFWALHPHFLSLPLISLSIITYSPGCCDCIPMNSSHASRCVEYDGRVGLSLVLESHSFHLPSILPKLCSCSCLSLSVITITCSQLFSYHPHRVVFSHALYCWHHQKACNSVSWMRRRFDASSLEALVHSTGRSVHPASH